MGVPFEVLEALAGEGVVDAKGGFQVVEGAAADEFHEDLLLDEGVDAVGEVGGGLGIEGLGELLDEGGVGGDPSVVLVEAGEGGFVGVEVEAILLAGAGENLGDFVVGVVLAELKDVALVADGEGSEFADLFHNASVFLMLGAGRWGTRFVARAP